MTREWKRQEKHGHSSFFFSLSPLFSCLFRSFYTSTAYILHRGTSRANSHFSLSHLASFARWQLLYRPDVSHAIYHIIENSRERDVRPLVNTTRDEPNFSIKRSGFRFIHSLPSNYNCTYAYCCSCLFASLAACVHPLNVFNETPFY